MTKIKSELDLSFIAEDLRSLAVPIDTVCEDPDNARTHSEINLQAIAMSYRTFGQRKPIVVNKRTGGVSEAGSGQLRAARDILGWTHIAVVWVDDDDDTAKAFAISDNRSGELAAWNNEVLIPQLIALGENVETTGFSGEDLEELQMINDFWTDEEKPTEEVGIGKEQLLPLIKIVIAVPGLSIVESALRLTGETHRGRALVMICEEYIYAHTEKKEIV